MTDEARTCGECRHFLPRGAWSDGLCDASVPVWTGLRVKDAWTTGERSAADCPCFERRAP